MLQTYRWAPCRVKWICLLENFGLYASFPKWLVPACSHPNAQCSCLVNSGAVLCAPLQELMVRDGQWQGTTQLRGIEPPGKQSLPSVKGDFKPCSLPSVGVNHTLPFSYKGTDFFLLWGLEIRTCKCFTVLLWIFLLLFLLFNDGFAELVYFLALELPLHLCFTFQNISVCSSELF